MALITLDNVRVAFGAFQALTDASFSIGAHEHVGLVGPNGSGKTTILRLITGDLAPDSGSVHLLSGTTIGFVPQDSELSGEGTLLEEVGRAASHVHLLEEQMRAKEQAISAASEDDMDALLAEYGELQHEFERIGGYAFDAELKETLTGLGLGPEHWETPVSALSGGQKTRAALAKLLLQKPAALVLDEPTNHLDIAACEWLEGFLQSFSGAALVVSHDRYLLNKVATRIIDLEGGVTRSYPGNYSAYLRQKEEFIRQQAIAWERQQEQIDKLDEFVRRYKAGQKSKQARGRAKLLARMERLERPRAAKQGVALDLAQEQASGRIALQLSGVSKSYASNRLFSGLDLIVERGERLGLIGPNGSGKTTLLRIMAGEIAPDSGSAEAGHGVEMAYFRQDRVELDPSSTVLEELLDAADLTSGEARSVAARFLFRGDDVFKKVAALSGGERNRLALAILMLAKPNLLLLDEPTNHLDVASREALGEAILAYDGTVVVTSHDRYLLNTVAGSILEISGGRASHFRGSYDDYAERVRTEAARARPSRKKQKPKPGPNRDRPRTRYRGPKPETLEREIAQLEQEQAELEQLLASPELYADHSRSAAAIERHEELVSLVAQMYEQWAEAAEHAAEAERAKGER